jgi:hypothetical protein
MGISAALSAAALAGVALQAAGQIKGGIDAKNAYDYNAAVAKQEGEFQEKRTDYELETHRRDLARIIGKQRVAGGASGVGASQSILLDTLTQAELDEQMIKTQGAINVWRAETAERGLKKGGKDFRTAGYISGGGTILGGLSRFDYRKKKTPKTSYKLPAHRYRELVR